MTTTKEEIVYRLRNGECLYQFHLGTPEEEEFLAHLIADGYVRKELGVVSGRMAYRYTWRHYVRVSVIKHTWFGVRRTEYIVEV